jgi:GH15 family glucan-1,4-alpha-glucosidase
MGAASRRADGYAPIADYALIGDGRTTALVARDGGIDWLTLPHVDSPSVFARILDAERGGAFTLQPTEPFEAERAYVEPTNVLETTFRTESGTVRVTDTMLLGDLHELAPLRELVRRVEGVAGEVELEWRIEPRFHYGRDGARWEQRGGHWAAQGRHGAVAVFAWDAGAPEAGDGALGGRLRVRAGDGALIDLAHAYQEPLVVPGRGEIERRLERTVRFWREWAGRMTYDGPWRERVARSALALKLLVFAPSGAIVAAPTTSLPEAIGGGRNWDYRYTWIRDAGYTLDALVRLGYDDEAQAYLWWVMHATRLTQPELGVLYDVRGGSRVEERELDHLAGYRGSSPVRVGNGAAGQRQLDVYGSFVHTVWLYVSGGHRIDRDAGKTIAKVADHICDVWRREDSGIWEVRGAPTHFVQSKAMCWVALDRAVRLAERGSIPDAHVERWRGQAREVRAFVDEQGWDEELQSYVRAPTMRELDASLLTLPLLEWAPADDERMAKTVDAVRRELADGPLVYRYRGEDGVADGGDEGYFLTCSFWLADALARTGRVDEAAVLMDELATFANDVGLYSEELEPGSRSFLGNFPQALTHLALVNAAVTIAEAAK